jgi:Transposase DDE domain
MSQTTRQTVSGKRDSRDAAQGLPFHEILSAPMVERALAAEGVQYNQSIFTPFLTLCTVLSQVLDPDHSCRAAVARVIVYLAVNGRKPCSEPTGAYCDARRRLPTGVIIHLVRQTAREAEARARPEWLWKGRQIYLADGSVVSMPDTPRNQRVFPQSRSQRHGLGFPMARLVVLISLATGLVGDLAVGPYRGKETGEPALFRQTWDRLEPGTVVLGDRVFASSFAIAGLSQRGVAGLFRMHQARRYDFRRGRRRGVTAHVVTWSKPARPEWMDEATYARMPDQLAVRELRFRVEQPGFRAHEIVLVTTRSDGELYTKEELADLYLKRWNIELDLRSIKDVLQMDVLRGRSPEMVEKEIWMHLLAYNLIRGVIVQAAEAHGKRPRQVSFKGALQTMTAFSESLRTAGLEQRDRLMAVMLKAIAGHRVGNRPGRAEPRANKRRPKKQRYLNEPRREARKRLLANAL